MENLSENEVHCVVGPTGEKALARSLRGKRLARAYV
jgi:hypothetical protein